MAERRFAAMGTHVHLIGVRASDESDTEALLDIAQARIHHLEARWSRFLPTSELSRINACAGTRTPVTPETFDLVAAAVDAGLPGACANLGGDVRMCGTAPGGGAWKVDIQDPTCTTTALALLEIDDGAIVTSTRLRRRWLVDGVEHHHLIDPRTGRPAESRWRTVSVAAQTCVDANVASTASFLLEDAPGWLETRRLPARLVSNEGDSTFVSGWPEDAA